MPHLLSNTKGSIFDILKESYLYVYKSCRKTDSLPPLYDYNGRGQQGWLLLPGMNETYWNDYFQQILSQSIRESLACALDTDGTTMTCGRIGSEQNFELAQISLDCEDSRWTILLAGCVIATSLLASTILLPILISCQIGDRPSYIKQYSEDWRKFAWLVYFGYLFVLGLETLN